MTMPPMQPFQRDIKESLRESLERSRIAPAICIKEKAVINAYRAGRITSDDMIDLLAVATRKKVELATEGLGRRLG